MLYTIVGRIVDDIFDGKSEDIVGYFVVDENGKRNFGSVAKVYKLYTENKLRGVQDFDTSGKINFSNTDNSLLPKFSASLFGSNSGAVCSVSSSNGVYQLRDSNGGTQQFSEKDIINGVRSGQIRLNNATISNDRLTINNSISVLGVKMENGKQVGYRVAMPNGEVKMLSKTEVIENLIKKHGFKLFNAKIDSSGNLVAKSGSLPKIEGTKPQTTAQSQSSRKAREQHLGTQSSGVQSSVGDNGVRSATPVTEASTALSAVEKARLQALTMFKDRIILKLEEPVTDINGVLKGYYVRYPSGELKKLSCDAICKLAGDERYYFDGDGFACWFKVDDGVVHCKDKGASVWRQKNEDYFFLLYKIFIIPYSAKDDEGLFEAIGVGYHTENRSALEVYIAPSHFGCRASLPLDKMRYSNITRFLYCDYSISNREFLDVCYRASDGLLFGYGWFCYEFMLYSLREDVMQRDTLELPEGIKGFSHTAFEDSNIRHLILPSTFEQVFGDWGDNIVWEEANNGLDSGYEISGNFKTITFKSICHSSSNSVSGHDDFDEFARRVIKKNPDVVFYVPDGEYKVLHDRYGDRVLNSGCSFELQEPIVDDVGYLLGYTVLHDGKIEKLKCDDICKLASQRGVSFRGDAFGKYFEVKVGVVYFKDNSDLAKANLLADLYSGRCEYFIVPSNVEFLDTDVEKFVEKEYDCYDECSRVKTLIVPSSEISEKFVTRNLYDDDMCALSYFCTKHLKYTNYMHFEFYRFAVTDNRGIKEMCVRHSGGRLRLRGVNLGEVLFFTPTKKGGVTIRDGVKYIADDAVCNGVLGLVLPETFQYFVNAHGLPVSMDEMDGLSEGLSKLQKLEFKRINNMKATRQLLDAMVLEHQCPNLKYVYVPAENYDELHSTYGDVISKRV